MNAITYSAAATLAFLLFAGNVAAADGTLQLAASDQRPDADDTERNVRDRKDTTLTPMDQGGSESDRTITQEIRRAVMAQDGFSTNAKNVKIITVDGVVTLRGPVKTADEKATIATLAGRTAGAKRVDNQLELERNP